MLITIIMPNKWRTIISLVYKFYFTADTEKGRLNPSRDKNVGKHRRRKVEKSCVAFLLYDPGWYVHKSYVQNKWDDNTYTHNTHMYVCKVITYIYTANKGREPSS